MFERMNNRAIVHYTIHTKSDLHIGGHGITAPAEVDSPVIKTPDGFPFIPGSSIKGVLRTEWERLLGGCGINTCLVPDVCGSKKRKNVPPCPVCLLFGGMSIASSVRVQDAFTSSPRTMIRDGVGIDRVTRKAKDNTKYDIEVVPKGTTFEGTMSVENLDISEHHQAKLGGLLSLIDFFNETAGRIGHATSRGFGSIRIDIDSLRIIQPMDYLQGNYNGRELKAGTPEYERVKKESQDEWQEFLANLLKNQEHKE